MRNKLFFCTFLILLTVSCRNEQLLQCNYSSADISTTEDESVVLAGFAARNQLSDGIHTKLKTNALVIRNGETSVCIVSSDIMELPPVVAEQIRNDISAKTGIGRDNIFIHCIHTHSAPRFGGDCAQQGGPNFAYKERAVNTIIDNAVNTANDAKAFKSFTFEVGKCDVGIGRNRCEEGGPYDPEAVAVKLVDSKGKPVCAFINLSCHPVCMGPSSYLLSADYSGVARAALSEAWGCEVFQLSGAQGNVDPVRGPRDYEYAEECGRQLAGSLSAVTFTPLQGSSEMKIRNAVAHLPYSIPEVRVSDIHKLADRMVAEYKTVFPRFIQDVRGWEKQMTDGLDASYMVRSLDYNVHALNLGGLLFFFTQGEPFCEYQMEAKKSFPDRNVIFAAYTNGQSSYIPSRRAYSVRKGYEYEIEQDFVYTKAPYSLSETSAAVYEENMFKTIAAVAGEPEVSLIPTPVHMERLAGYLDLSKGVRISADDSCFNEIIEDFKGDLGFKGVSYDKIFGKALEIRKIEGLKDEAYNLVVSPKGIKIESSSVSGAFYGLQTVLQLIPAASDSLAKAPVVPCCSIVDYPRFAFRGMQLDCGRYFYPKEDVISLIDQMAAHKQNYLHWHLTEDQGWRIEIEKYPRLTEVGAWRKETSGYNGTGDGIRHGGYYPKDEIREIVDHARRRCVTIIPEIELPGHSSAAIAAYPFLSCTPDEPKEVATAWGVKKDVYCPSPETVEFLENVFLEVLELFPSKYYHIGGDECPKDAWHQSAYCHKRAKELGLAGVDDIQAWFVHHFVDFLEAHGKTVIGWDEILERNPAPSSVILSYRGHQPGAEAMEKDMNVIFTPNRWCYYDNMQDEVEDLPKNHHIFTTLRKAYTWDFAEIIGRELADSKADKVLGMEACLWGEFIPDGKRLEYQTYPRLAAIAEISWSPLDSRNWNSFRMRMPEEFRRLDMKGINYCPSYFSILVNMDLTIPYPRLVELELDDPFAEIRYSIGGAEPEDGYEYPIVINKGDSLRARPVRLDGTIAGAEISRKF